MKSLSPEDASILAVAAEHPGMSEEMLRGLLKETSSPRVKKILRALNSAKVNKTSSDVRSAAKGLKLWADRNKRVHSGSKGAKKT